MNAKTVGNATSGSSGEDPLQYAVPSGAAKPGAQVQPEFDTVGVDPDDRIAAICGKIDAAHSADIALRVSHGNSELNTEVGMRLLMRHADRTGKRIVLVTRRNAIRQVARAEGQPCVGDIRKVRFDHGTRARRLGFLDLSSPVATGVAWLCGVMVVLVVAGIVTFGLVPSATITLFPPVTAASQDALFSLNTVANRVDPAAAVVPATRKGRVVNTSITLPVTGRAMQDRTAGDAISVPAVDSDDITTAKNLASAILATEGARQLERQSGPGWRFFPETADVENISVDTDQPAGAKVPVLNVTYRGSVTVLGARDDDMRTLLYTELQKNMQDSSKLVDSSVRLTVLKSGPFDPAGERLPLLMRLDASTTPETNFDSLRRAVEGKSRRQALAIAEQATTADHPPILRLAPGWAPWLPRLARRINVEVAASP
jgi:hypothetical protein